MNLLTYAGGLLSVLDRIYSGYIQRTIDAEAKKIEILLPSLIPIDPKTLKEFKQKKTGALIIFSSRDTCL